MRGIVLAAGGGTRLRPLTDTLPKTLLPVDHDGRSVLEIAVANLSAVDVTDIAVVVGHAADRVDEVRPELERRYSVDLRLVYNERYADWNNAYSLWCARDVYGDGALMLNGDTVHPVDVEQRLLDARGSAPIIIALDDEKQLGEEEMKVVLDAAGRLRRINKALDVAEADGEYIGATLIEPEAADGLSESLQATFERDTSLYYEDGYQEYANRGGDIRTASVGGISWVEVDDHADLERAREIACRY